MASGRGGTRCCSTYQGEYLEIVEAFEQLEAKNFGPEGRNELFIFAELLKYVLEVGVEHVHHNV